MVDHLLPELNLLPYIAIFNSFCMEISSESNSQCSEIREYLATIVSSPCMENPDFQPGQLSLQPFPQAQLPSQSAKTSIGSQVKLLLSPPHPSSMKKLSKERLSPYQEEELLLLISLLYSNMSQFYRHTAAVINSR